MYEQFMFDIVYTYLLMLTHVFLLNNQFYTHPLILFMNQV